MREVLETGASKTVQSALERYSTAINKPGTMMDCHWIMHRPKAFLSSSQTAVTRATGCITVQRFLTKRKFHFVGTKHSRNHCKSEFTAPQDTTKKQRLCASLTGESGPAVMGISPTPTSLSLPPSIPAKVTSLSWSA